MFQREMYHSTDLIEPLRERGVEISREQIYRLFAGQPKRLNLETLGALMDILECEPGDLIQRVETPRPKKRKRQKLDLSELQGPQPDLGDDDPDEI